MHIVTYRTGSRKKKTILFFVERKREKKSISAKKKTKKRKKKKKRNSEEKYTFENCHLVVNCRFTFVTHYYDCFPIDLNALSEFQRRTKEMPSAQTETPKR